MNDTVKRLARVIENDSNGVINRTLRVAESDVVMILSQYMEINSLDMRVQKSDSGYTLEIKADVNRFFDVGKTSEEFVE